MKRTSDALCPTLGSKISGNCPSIAEAFMRWLPVARNGGSTETARPICPDPVTIIPNRPAAIRTRKMPANKARLEDKPLTHRRQFKITRSSERPNFVERKKKQGYSGKAIPRACDAACVLVTSIGRKLNNYFYI